MIKKIVGKIFGFSDEIINLERRIEELSWDDPFGMWTRQGFLNLCEIMPRGKRTVIFLDLNSIHSLNKKLGFSQVDDKVRSVFSESFRKSDIVARWYSGDEIVILMDCNIKNAKAKMKNLQKHASNFDIGFVYTLGLWDVGIENIIDIVDSLSKNIHKEKELVR